MGKPRSVKELDTASPYDHMITDYVNGARILARLSTSAADRIIDICEK